MANKTEAFAASGFLKSLRGLRDWYAEHRRVLPWREDPSVYRVWVSEIMLQQTQVAAVVPYFNRFIERFPDVTSLADAPESDVMLRWAGLGYYSRARNLHRAAKEVRDAGVFPTTREGWEKLPGVGRYTAGAVLSIAMNVPEAILDANVKRVFSRVFLTNDKGRLWETSGKAVLAAAASGFSPSSFNQALMELGALVCSAARPECPSCPFSGVCGARAAGRTARYPARQKKKWLEVNESRAAVIDAKGRILLHLDPEARWRKGLWDLPEKPPFALRTLKEAGSLTTKHTVTNHRITRVTAVYRLNKAPSGAGRGLSWAGIGEIAGKNSPIALGAAARKTIEKLPVFIKGK